MMDWIAQMMVPSWQAAVFTGVWLLGVSYAAGRALSRVSDHERRLNENSRNSERLGTLENDMRWVKGSLRRIERKLGENGRTPGEKGSEE